MVDKTIEVHLAHCCYFHGCKYGDDISCPVFNGINEQYYVCEECISMDIKNIEEIKAMKILNIDKCSSCGTYHKSKREVIIGLKTISI